MRQLKISQSITNRHEASVNRYLVEVSHIDLINAEEEARLGELMAAGDTVALHKLINANLRFVVSVAKQYQNRGLVLSDLIMEGNLGLIKAANRFDHTKGFKFISFAVNWIRQSILQAIAEQKRVVRLPGNRLNDIHNLTKAATRLEQLLERPASVGELAEELGFKEARVMELFTIGMATSSLDRQLGSEENNCLLDMLKDDNALCPERGLMTGSLSTDIVRILNKLPVKEQLVLKYTYGIDGYPELSSDDIAEHLKVTKERIRQLKTRAIERLKRDILSRCVKEYIG
ncbi:RNA polymerase sigma factor RpoD/SigA [Pedobacter heparinus]|uniref:sigma-70 family RNA polymerase sigma factor n=1 Tax=Pedobacter heparinus TaxID=984 RepID=UPI00292F8813|nr:RNA polymerase sigma factor RpoD/SigA [Pedobacter heparinus]